MFICVLLKLDMVLVLYQSVGFGTQVIGHRHLCEAGWLGGLGELMGPKCVCRNPHICKTWSASECIWCV